MRQFRVTQSITNRDSNAVNKYLQEISREELITAEEEVELARRIKEGNKKALEKLTRANLRFVVSIAKQYLNQGLTLLDLINEGNLGLIKAAQRFDETRGFKFISYAVWWIRQSILQAIAEQSRMVRLPLNQVSSLNKLKRAFSELEQKYEREPSVEELSSETEIPKDKIDEVTRIYPRHVSMDTPIESDHGDENTLHDLLKTSDCDPDERLTCKESLSKDIQRALATLSKREREILKLFFGIGVPQPLTPDEISEKFGLTKERVRQVKERGIRRLQTPYRKKLLKYHLG